MQNLALQAILCGGQMIGRPLCGLALDRYGRLNMAAAFTFVSGLSILLIWSVSALMQCTRKLMCF